MVCYKTLEENKKKTSDQLSFCRLGPKKGVVTGSRPVEWDAGARHVRQPVSNSTVKIQNLNRIR